MMPIVREVQLSFSFNKPDPLKENAVRDQFDEISKISKFQFFPESCLNTVEWGLCQTFESHFTQLTKSTFSLIIVQEKIGMEF